MLILLSIAISVAFFFLGVIHIYWAMGGVWPGTDFKSFALTVIGSDEHLPPRWMSFAVAGTLTLCSLVPVSYTGLVALPIQDIQTNTILHGIAIICILRGIGGYFDHILRPGIINTPYYRLNQVLYSPICIALSVATALLLYGETILT